MKLTLKFSFFDIWAPNLERFPCILQWRLKHLVGSKTLYRARLATRVVCVRYIRRTVFIKYICALVVISKYCNLKEPQTIHSYTRGRKSAAAARVQCPNVSQFCFPKMMSHEAHEILHGQTPLVCPSLPLKEWLWSPIHYIGFYVDVFHYYLLFGFKCSYVFRHRSE